MITIKKSSVTDTRTCDFTKVTKEMLLEATNSHIGDMRKGLMFLQELPTNAKYEHDRTKLSEL